MLNALLPYLYGVVEIEALMHGIVHLCSIGAGTEVEDRLYKAGIIVLPLYVQLALYQVKVLFAGKVGGFIVFGKVIDQYELRETKLVQIADEVAAYKAGSPGNNDDIILLHELLGLFSRVSSRMSFRVRVLFRLGLSVILFLSSLGVHLGRELSFATFMVLFAAAFRLYKVECSYEKTGNNNYQPKCVFEGDDGFVFRRMPVVCIVTHELVFYYGANVKHWGDFSKCYGKNVLFSAKA